VKSEMNIAEVYEIALDEDAEDNRIENLTAWPRLIGGTYAPITRGFVELAMSTTRTPSEYTTDTPCPRRRRGCGRCTTPQSDHPRNTRDSSAFAQWLAAEVVTIRPLKGTDSFMTPCAILYGIVLLRIESPAKINWIQGKGVSTNAPRPNVNANTLRVDTWI
jgi:hypothetical protein